MAFSHNLQDYQLLLPAPFLILSGYVLKQSKSYSGCSYNAQPVSANVIFLSFHILLPPAYFNQCPKFPDAWAGLAPYPFFLFRLILRMQPQL